MKKRISRLGVHKTALTVAVMAAVITLPFILLMFIPMMFAEQGVIPFLPLLLAPIVYLIFGYIFTAFWCWVYNLIASKTKIGVVITLDDVV